MSYPSRNNGQFLQQQQSTSPYQPPVQHAAWDATYNMQSLYNTSYPVPQAIASPSQVPMYFPPAASVPTPFSQPTQYPPHALSVPAPYSTVSAAAVPVPQRHSYPPTSYHQSPVISSSRSTSVSPPRSASSPSSPGSSQFAVMAPGGRTLASSSNYKEAMHTARSMQRGDGISPADDTRQCPHCGKICDRPSTLRTHLNSHTGLRPHTCPVPGCGRQFTVLSNMYRHAKTCPALHNHDVNTAGEPVLLSLPSSSRM